jgi:hypothetical protein
MRWSINAVLILAVCATGGMAGPISTSASADLFLSRFDSQRGIWVPTYNFHASNQGTSSAQAGFAPTPDVSAGASASMTGLTFEAGASSFFSFRNNYYGTARSAAEAVLDDTFNVPLYQWRMQVDLLVNPSSGWRARTGLEVWIGNSRTGWEDPYQYGPILVTASGSALGGVSLPIRVRVWATSDADGIGYASGRSEVILQSIRAYDSAGQLTGFTYRTGSGRDYPVEGGILLPEPGTALLLLLGGLFIMAGRRVVTVR